MASTTRLKDYNVRIADSPQFSIGRTHSYAPSQSPALAFLTFPTFGTSSFYLPQLLRPLWARTSTTAGPYGNHATLPDRDNIVPPIYKGLR